MSEEELEFGEEEEKGGVGNKTIVKKKLTKAEIRKIKQIDELREILKIRKGRAFLWRVISECGVYKAAPNIEMERFEGRRDIGLWLLEEFFSIKGDYYSLMKAESMEDSKNYGIDA